MECKYEGDERRKGKGERTSGEVDGSAKSDAGPGNDGKTKPREKRKNDGDLSNEFPNFAALTKEERLVFFEALSSARRNVEKTGAATRQRFGTVHDDYLQVFDGVRRPKEVGERPSSNSSSATYTLSLVPDDAPESTSEKSVISIPDDLNTDDFFLLDKTSNLKFPMGSFPEEANLCDASNVTSSALGDQAMADCETLLVAERNQMVDLYMKRKRQEEEKKRCDGSSSSGSPAASSSNSSNQETTDELSTYHTFWSQTKLNPLKSRETVKSNEETVRGEGSTDAQVPEFLGGTPKFDALNPEEKELFFKILREAHDNVYQKKPKTEIVSLGSILKRYEREDAAQPTRTDSTGKTSLTYQKDMKKLRINLKVTSVDNQRLKEEARKRRKAPEPPRIEEPAREKPEEVKKKNDQVPETRHADKEDTKADKVDGSTETESNRSNASNENDKPSQTKMYETPAEEEKKEKVQRDEPKNVEGTQTDLATPARVESGHLDKKPLTPAEGKTSLLKEEIQEPKTRPPVDDQRDADSKSLVDVEAADKRKPRTNFAGQTGNEEKMADANESKDNDSYEVPKLWRSVMVDEKDMMDKGKIDLKKKVAEEKKQEETPQEQLDKAKPKSKLPLMRKNKKRTSTKVGEIQTVLTSVKDEEDSAGKRKGGQTNACCGRKRPEQAVQQKPGAGVRARTKEKDGKPKATDTTGRKTPSKPQPCKQKKVEPKASESAVDLSTTELHPSASSMADRSELKLKVRFSSDATILNSNETEDSQEGVVLSVKEDEQDDDDDEEEEDEDEDDEENDECDCARAVDEVEEKDEEEAEDRCGWEEGSCKRSEGQVSLKLVDVEFEETGGGEKSGRRQLAEDKFVLETTVATAQDPKETKKETKVCVNSVPELMSSKVVLMDDSVIEKVKQLIGDLEKKARQEENPLGNEYVQLLLDYIDYLSKVLHALIASRDEKSEQFRSQVRSSLTSPNIYIKFQEHVTPKLQQGELVTGKTEPPQPVHGEPTKKSEEEDDGLGTPPSFESLSSDSEPEQSLMVPMFVKRKRLPTTKIRVLQDLLKEKAVFVEGSISDFKVVHVPQAGVDVDTPTAQFHAEEEEDTRSEKATKFGCLKALAKLCRCGKKESTEEDNLLENLKGEAVAVDVSKGEKTPASVTLNESTMEVLKAAQRKKIIQKYWKTS